MGTQLQNIFAKDINRHFEGVIKADDQDNLLLELEEYVVTDEIAQQLLKFFEAYNGAATRNGVWLSGFFGSGKSHLLKILSHLLENKKIEETRVSDVFLPKVEDSFLKGAIQNALRIPSKSILFNIDQKSDTQTKNQADAILGVFMKVFNEMQGYYPKHGFVAELEHDLHKKDELDSFRKRYEELTGESWEEGRDAIFLEADNFAQALADVRKMSKLEASKVLDRYEKEYKLTIEGFSQRVKEWLDQQEPGFRLNFFVDEIGQYISDNTKLMLNLQTIVESLATICKGQAWVIVTSQEDVESVLGEMNARQSNDFSRIQDRFRTRMPLTSVNADEVIQKRILAKDESIKPTLEQIYEREGNNLKTLFRFGGGSRTYRGFKNAKHFVDCYPFLPYQFELFHAASRAMSTQRAFTGRHRSVGERSMLDVFRQVVIKNQHNPVNALMSFESMYEGLEATIKSQFRNGVIVADQNLGNNFAVRVLKALFLVKYVKEFKATPQNIAALLVDNIDMDLAKHEKKVREALDLLERETYIQRNEETYEYLTDEEKDIEREIKSTELEPTAVRDMLSKIVFDDILRDTRIRFETNRKDYPFARILDEQIHGREAELRLHVVSPNHADYESPDVLATQTMGGSAMIARLNTEGDKRLLDDMRLFLQTQRYVQRENRSSLSDNRKRILNEKANQNLQRRQYITKRLEDALGTAAYLLHGDQLGLKASKAQARMREAFQQFIAYMYPRLEEMKADYAEGDISKTMQLRFDDLFQGDAASLTVPEDTILLQIRRNAEKSERTSIQRLIDFFEKRPYGWYQAGILVQVARLYKRGLLELRREGHLLEEDHEVIQALSSNREYKSTSLRSIKQVDPARLKALQDFYQEFFHETCPEREAKAAAQALKAKIKAEAHALERRLEHKGGFPFLKQLVPVIERMNDLAHKSYEYYLQHLEEFEDDLLNAREDLLDPLEQFFNGEQKDIFTEIKKLVDHQQENMEFVAAEARPLFEVVRHASPYKGPVMQQAKRDLEAYKSALASRLLEEREQAGEKVHKLLEVIQKESPFQDLEASHQDQVVGELQHLKNQLARISTISYLRERAQHAEGSLFPAALTRISDLARAEARRKQAANPPQTKSGIDQGHNEGEAPVAEPKPEPKTIKHVSYKTITVPFHKRVLQDESDLEAYLEALRETYKAELEQGNRITV